MPAVESRAAPEDESGRFGYHLPGFVSVEHAIATAWHERAPGSRCHAYVLDPSVEMHASNIAWREPDVVLLDDVVGDETWEPLQWTIGKVPCNGLGFELSSRGRLRHGEHVTRGVAAQRVLDVDETRLEDLDGDRRVVACARREAARAAGRGRRLRGLHPRSRAASLRGFATKAAPVKPRGAAPPAV